LPNESRAIICPNPECHREIEEPILLNNLSVAPAEQYYACPHCFIKLDAEAENEEETTQESTSGPPSHSVLEKVLDAISAQPEKEEKEKEKKKKEEHPVKQPEKEGKGASECPYNFGYLASRGKDAPIPQECLTCPRIVDCMLKRGS